MAAGKHARAFELMDATRAHFDDMESSTDVARILGGSPPSKRWPVGSTPRAPTPHERSEIAQRAGNETFLANVLNGRAWALQRDDPEEALAVAEQFLEIYRRTGVARGVASGLTALAAGLAPRASATTSARWRCSAMQS